MATELSIIERFHEDLLDEDWRAYNEYRSISVLVIRREKSDNSGFEEEGLMIVECHAIPSITQLLTFLDNFVAGSEQQSSPFPNWKRVFDINS